MRKPGVNGWFVVTGVVALLLGGFARALDQEPVPSHQLSEFSPGPHLSGPEIDLKKLQGRVVAIEFWGTR